MYIPYNTTDLKVLLARLAGDTVIKSQHIYCNGDANRANSVLSRLKSKPKVEISSIKVKSSIISE